MFAKKISDTQFLGVLLAEKIFKKYKGAMNYDVTGFGKSVQGLELACRSTSDTGRILYICPAGAAPDVKEYWNDGLTGTKKRVLIIQPYSQIVNPHLFKSLMAGEYDFCVVDEAHRVKGLIGKKDTLHFFNEKHLSIAHAKDKKYVLQAYAVFALLRRCKQFFFMTATPLVNALSDIYPFLRMIDHPLVQHGYYNYLDTWSETVTRTPFGTKWEGLKNEKAFAKALSDCAFGRLHKDEKDPKLRVPEPLEFFEEIPLPEELVLCDKYIENKLEELGIDILEMGPKKLSKLLGELPGFESLSRFREAQGFAKIPITVDYVKRLYKHKASKGKIILWCYHKEVARKFQEELKSLGIPTLMFTSNITSSKRAAFVKHANSLDKCVLIGTKAMSENFNLHTFFHAVWSEYDYTKKTLDQQKGRILRKGMQDPSSFHFLKFDRGVEDRIWELVLSKTKMIKGALSL
jgi:hypothetical protein